MLEETGIHHTERESPATLLESLEYLGFVSQVDEEKSHVTLVKITDRIMTEIDTVLASFEGSIPTWLSEKQLRSYECCLSALEKSLDSGDSETAYTSVMVLKADLSSMLPSASRVTARSSRIGGI
jgi:hypothetical protein